MSVTYDVSNSERSRGAFTTLNIPLMFVTLEVSKCETSSILRLRQVPNIPRMFVTLDVSKCETSRDLSFQQSPNIKLMSVTLEVSNDDNPIMSSKTSQ